MATKSNLINIKCITKTSKFKAIEARVLRMWNKKDFGKSYIEMILIDMEGGKIQATIPTTCMPNFKSVFIEGENFRISNFALTGNDPHNQKARAEHICMLKISIGTKVTRLESDVAIPVNGFQFVPFSSFISDPNSGLPMSVDSAFTFDVIGRIILPIGDIETVPKAFNKRKMDVKLIDNQGFELGAILWKQYADELNAYVNSRGEDTNEPIVLILQFAVLSSYMRVHRASTMVGATKMFINPDFPEVIQLKKDHSQGTPISSKFVTAFSTTHSRNVKIDDYMRFTDYKTISELLECSEYGVYTVHATIFDVDTDKAWYYDACNSGNCNKKIETNVKVCRGCNKEVKGTVPRFMLRICVRSAEGTDDSTAIFTLFDRDAKSLLNLTASEALEQTERDGTSGGFPDAILEIFERECLFRVKVDDYLINHNSSAVSNDAKSFAVQKLIWDPELISHIKSQIVYEESEVASRPTDQDTKELEITGDNSQTSANNDVSPDKRPPPAGIVDVEEDFQLSTTALKGFKKVKIEKND